MSRAALDESLARLDAAMGATTPIRPYQRTSLIAKGRQVTTSNLSSVLDGQMLDTSLNNTESPFANISGIGESALGNMSLFGVDVTAPVMTEVGGADQTIDMTTTILPPQHNAQVLFSEFVRVLVGEQCGSGQEGGVWGEVMEYEALCHQQAQHIEKIFRRMPRQHQASARTKQVLQQLVGERNMWRLLHSLYIDRQCRSDEPADDATDMCGWLKSDQTVITELYDASREIREGQLVVDWLEKSASETLQQLPEKLEHYSDSHVAWENTLRVVKASARGHGQGVGSERLVSSVDPDAPVRQSKPLHDLDQEDERVLVRRIMLCLRSGEVSEAQDKCVGSGQHWRAAAMEGWKLHHDPNVTDPTKRSAVQGNPYRDVWKRLAWKASEDTRLSQYQRALYGSLCGNLSAMLLVCHEWEDLLWAHARALVDQRVEEKLRMAHAHARPRSLVALPKKYPEQRMSMSGVLTSVEQCSSQGVEKNPYYLMCKHIILDDMDGLLLEAQRWLDEGPAPHLLRCVTHLLLVLRRIYRIVEPHQEETANAVLHACVKAAMERGDVEQVAWYTAMLPNSQQVPCYAGFLLNITDPPQRRHALHLAHTVGLDTHTIATTTAAMIRLSPVGSMVEGDGLVGETVQGDRIKIAGLDWLLFDDELRQEALIQGLSLLRTFLISRKISAANITMDKLPSDTLSLVSGDDKDNLTPEVEAAVREFLCIRTFLSAQESFSDWFDHYHQQKPSAPAPLPVASTFTEQIAHEHATLQYEALEAKWQGTLDNLSKNACDRLYNVLLFPDGGWLVDPVPLPHTRNSSQSGDCDGASSTGQQRLQHLSPELAAREPDREHQLVTLRSIYIPQVCSLLQSVLSCTGQHMQCLQLADIIASEQHQLYTAFGSAEMQRFLLKMLEPSRHLLDNDKDALGYPLQ